MQIKARVIMIPILNFSCACSNALYFYDTQKVSFAAEVRPDSSEPVQGNLGLKHREAIIVPAKDGGDALSLISHFRFDKGSAGGFGTIRMTAAFVTGDAAISVDANKRAPEVAAALSGVALSTYSELAKQLIETVKQKNKLPDLQRATTKDWRDLTSTDFATLTNITGLDRAEFNQSFYEELRHQAAAAKQ
jgi:hypothetical protein